MKRALFRSLVLIATVSLALSCSDHMAPVKEFLEEYTDAAAIGKMTILTEWRKDPSGAANVPSASSSRIRFLMRNPRNYEISTTLEFADPAVTANASEYSITFAEDRQSLELEFTPGFLERYEGGKNISATLNLSNAESEIPFAPYSFTLFSNTAPPAPAGARVMISASSTNVVCCNIDLSDEIHDDIVAISVNGVMYPVASATAGGTQSITFASGASASTTAPAGMQAHAGSEAFSPDPAMTSVYLMTGDSSAAHKNYLVSVIDGRGLSSSVSVSSNPNQLGQVIATDSTGALLPSSPDSSPVITPLMIPSGDTTTSVTLTAAPGSTIHWSYTRNGTELNPGLINASPYTMNLEPGEYVITAYAQMAGYINSDPVTVRVNVSAEIIDVYVNPAQANDTHAGTLDDPVKTISYAVTLFSNPNNERNTIHLLGDITMAETGYTGNIVHIEPTRNLRFTLDGGNNEINGGDSRRCIYIRNINAYSVSVTIQNLTISHGGVTSVPLSGAGIYFLSTASGSSLTISNCTVENCVVSTGSSGSGGGIYAETPEVTLNQGTFIRQNQVSSTINSCGGGVYVKGATNLNIGDTMSGCNFEGNSASSNQYTLGGGIRCEGTSSTQLTICTVTNTSFSLNTGATIATDIYGNGGAISAVNTDITISACNITNNTANTAGNGEGGGVYVKDGILSLSGGTTIVSNEATVSTTAASGRGGGVFIDSNVTATISSATIEMNWAADSTNCTGYGGGIYVSAKQAPDARLTISSGAAIQNNIASTRYQGYGGGLYLTSGTTGMLTVAMEGGSITDNKATTEDGVLGIGGGIWLGLPNQTMSAPITFTMAGGTIENNKASLNGSGSGGGIYATHNSKVTIEDGTISLNSGSPEFTSTGDGICITGSTTGRSLLTVTGGTITNNGSNFMNTLTGVYIVDSYVDFTIIGNGSVADTNRVYLAGSATINVPEFLTNENVAIVQLQNLAYNVQVLRSDGDSRPQINYYKFTMYPQTDPLSWCVNAEGNASYVNNNNVSSFGDLQNAISAAPVDGRTQLINILMPSGTLSMSGGDAPITIKSNSHVRLVSSMGTQLTTTSITSTIIDVRSGGHLLIDANPAPITLAFGSQARAYPAILVNWGGSIVIRGMEVLNAFTNDVSPSDAALVQGGNSNYPTCIVLDSFTFSKSALRMNSYYSALMLPRNTRCYFISGSITGFTSFYQMYGGVAHVAQDAEFWVFGGTFTNNTLSPYNSSVSVDSGGTLENPNGIALQ